MILIPPARFDFPPQLAGPLNEFFRTQDTSFSRLLLLLCLLSHFCAENEITLLHSELTTPIPSPKELLSLKKVIAFTPFFFACRNLRCPLSQRLFTLQAMLPTSSSDQEEPLCATLLLLLSLPDVAPSDTCAAL